MNGDVRLSVIIPMFNGESYISHIVNDIFMHNANTDFVYEIILVDDGSTDATQSVCLELTEQYPHIRYFWKENGGIASARNVGLSQARGKYVTFADQDDSILQGYSKFLNQCDDEELDMIITSPYNKRGNSDTMNLRKFRDETIIDAKRIKKVAGKLIDGEYLSDDTVQFVSTSVWNVIYRREMILDNNILFKVFIDYEDDWIFNIEALLSSCKIAISAEGYYCWNIRQGSESHRKKYIDKLLNKRKSWMRWLTTVLDAMDIDEEIADKFAYSVLIPRNIMMCFNNACWKTGASKKEILTEVRNACDAWKINEVNLQSVEKMDWKNRLLLHLLKMGYIDFAYSLNKRILRRRFH